MNKLVLLLSGILFFTCCSTGSSKHDGYLHSGYTKEELTDMGVNTSSLFVFTDKCARYNGKEFAIDIPIDSLVATFGSYDRIVYGEGGNKGYDNYFWDNIGCCAVTTPEQIVMCFDLHWEYEQDKKESESDDSNDSKDIPANFFKGKILLNGYPIDNTSDVAAYCNDEAVREQLKGWAHELGIGNYKECFYYFFENKGFYLYNYYSHELYLYDYDRLTALRGSSAEESTERPFFSYIMKVHSGTNKLHSFGLRYGVYSNPDFNFPIWG